MGAGISVGPGVNIGEENEGDNGVYGAGVCGTS